MPTDPSIILSGQTPQLDYGTIAGNALKLRAMQTEMQTQNALRQLFSEPGAVDPTTGQPTANTLSKVMRIDPTAGLKLTEGVAAAEERQAQTEHAKSETQQQNMKLVRDKASELHSVYKAAVESGNVDPAQAERDLKEGAHEWIKGQAWMSQAQQDKLASTIDNMKPAQLDAWLKAQSLTAEESATQEREGQVEKRQEATEKERERHDREVERLAIERPEVAAENRPAQLLTDPTTGKQYWAHPGTRNQPPSYTDLDGNPYRPGGAGHISSGVVRSGLAGAIQAAQEENQKAGKGPLSSEQIEQISADYERKSRAGVAFATGKQGDQVRSLNVSIDHLDTLKEAAQALHNGDVKKLNSLKQKWAEEFGSPIPTNFQALSQIVSQEVHKGVAGVGGSAGEREDLSKNASAASSPDQLIGVIDSTQKLLAGQESGLRRQYQQATGLDNFDDLLSPRAREILNKDGGGGGHSGGRAAAGHSDIARPSSKADFDALPKGAHYSKPGDPPGTYRVKS